MGYSGAGMKLIHEKNLKSTTSCQIPFKANTHVGSYKLFYSMPILFLDGLQEAAPLKKKIKFSSYIRKFRRDRLQSHI